MDFSYSSAAVDKISTDIARPMVLLRIAEHLVQRCVEVNKQTSCYADII